MTANKDVKKEGIPDGWIETTVGEVAETNISSIDKNYNLKSILYLDTGSITEGEIKSLKRLLLSDAPSRARRLVKDKDIIYSTVRPDQRHFGFIENPKENLVVSTGFTVISTILKKADPKFLFYFLTRKEITSTLQKTAEHSTSTYPSIKPTDIERLNILLPPLLEQKYIANLFASFDNKIELLRKQNRTLETITQTVFNEYFVKYSFDRPEELPKGWRVGSLQELAEHIKETIKPSLFPSDLFDHYSLPAYDAGLIPIVEDGSEIKSNKYRVHQSAFLVSKLNPFTPRIWTILRANRRAVCSTEFQVVKPKNEIFFSYIHCLLNSTYFTADLSQKIKGTSSSHQRVNPQDIFDVKCTIPTILSLKSFNEIADNLINMIDVNYDQIQYLSKIRNTLLPKLMNGDIRVNSK